MTLIKVEQLADIQAKLPADIAEVRRTLATDQDHVVAVASLELEDLYRMAAVVSFLSEADVAAFHENLYLAAAVRRRFLTCVDRGMKTEQEYLFATYDKAIYEALCAGEPQVLEDLARNKLTTKADTKFDNPYSYYFSLAVRVLTVRDNRAAAKLLGTFDEHRRGALEGHSRIAHGIVEGNATLFNEGLELALEERKAQIASDEDVFVGEQWLSVECLALVRLGRAYEMEPQATDRLIPEELQGAPPVTYPDAAAVLPPIPDRFVELPEEAVSSDDE